MSKRKQYKPKHTSIPMIVNREIHKNVETLNENMMLLAFRFGHAQKMHFDQLALMANMIEIAHQTKPSDESKVLAENLKSVATKIKARYDKKQKLGISAEEMNTLKWCLSAYDDYWKRQTTTLYNLCVAEVKEFYAELEEERAA
ncbi:MAG: hypothetical protein WC733_00035 [Methylophilus sp.]|jgi:hypothetical protein